MRGLEATGGMPIVPGMLKAPVRLPIPTDNDIGDEGALALTAALASAPCRTVRYSLRGPPGDTRA